MNFNLYIIVIKNSLHNNDCAIDYSKTSSEILKFSVNTVGNKIENRRLLRRKREKAEFPKAKKRT